MSALDPSDIRDAFAVFNEDESRAHRMLVARLYHRPQAWHDAQGPHGDTLLLAAVRHGHDASVDLLLKKKFAPDAWNDNLDTALHLLRTEISANLLVGAQRGQLALEANADGDLPLHVHLRAGNKSISEKLLDLPTSEAQVIRRNRNNETVLFDAARSQPDLIVKLILAGADPRIQNNDGKVAADFCTDPKGLKTLTAYAAHYNVCDEDARLKAIDEVESKRALSLAQRAREFLVTHDPAQVPTSSGPQA